MKRVFFFSHIFLNIRIQLYLELLLHSLFFFFKFINKLDFLSEVKKYINM